MSCFLQERFRLSIGSFFSLTHFSWSSYCETLGGMFPAWNPDQPEITDLMVQHDSCTLGRLPVHKQELLDVFSRFHNRKAVRAVLELLEQAGNLEDREIDALLLTVRWEMPRLAEEFYHGQRVWELLCPVVATIRQSGFRETLRIVDVGCGKGIRRAGLQ